MAYFCEIQASQLESMWSESDFCVSYISYIATLLTLDHGLDNSLPANVVAILFICLIGYWDIVRKFSWNSLHGICQIWISTSYPHYCFRILKRDQRRHCYHGIILFDWIALCLDQLSYVKFNSSYCIFNSLMFPYTKAGTSGILDSMTSVTEFESEFK